MKHNHHHKHHEHHELVSPPSQSPHISHEEIALRAYERFTRRGADQGNSDEDWYLAEQELLDEARDRS
jgi:hypothetical protein